MRSPWPAFRAAALALLCLSAAPGRAAAQGSPYVPTDDPSLPLFEHLVARGAVADPSPQVRPFRRADALRALAAADTAPGSADARLVRTLVARWTPPEGELRWSIEPRAGVQAGTAARRDALHPAGEGGAWAYAELGASATFGPFVLATRPVVEPRLKDDPDWPGRRDVTVLSRLAEGYVAGQFKYGSFLYGQLDHNWGPVGQPGYPLSDYAYERQGLHFAIGTRTLRLSAFGGDLRDELDSLQRTVHRYYFAHRLDARLSERLHLAAWEGIVVSGVDREFETRYRNPLALSYLANALGLGDRSNVMLGLDATWRAFGRHTLQLQLAIDDFWYENREANRDRWGFTVMATGPVGGALAYRGYYTQTSALALRAFDRFDNFLDAGVGIGRNFTDNDRLTLEVGWPARPGWLVTTEATLFRQGEGDPRLPYPLPGTPEAIATPGLFVGTVERTWRAALGLSGREGPFALRAEAAYHHVRNAGHVAGATDDRLEARLQATIGLRREGRLRDDTD